MSATGQRLWPLLAPLVPRLHAQAAVDVQTFRGEPWYVVVDRESGAAFRLSGGAAVLFDAGAGDEPLAARVAARHPDAGAAFLEQLCLAALGLYRQGLLDFQPAAAVPPELARLRQPAPRRARFNPLGLRIPLGDPDRLLERLAPLARALFTPTSAVLLAGVIAAFIVLASLHADAFAADLLSRVQTPSHWLGFALCYLLLKALHELAHALAVKHWGGHVHDVGLMLLVFFPVPYVDASASTAFGDKRQRMVVAAAGIAAELAFAGLGMIAWVNTEPGLVHTLAFNLVVVGGVSTLLFNGNPLLRFDAYYVLSDWLEIPNLYTRSRSALAARCAALFGVRHDGQVGGPAGEARWLLGYGLASSVYRLGVLGVIALYLAQTFFVIGVALATWVLVSEIALPLVRFTARLRASDAARSLRVGACGRAALAATALLAFAAFVPLPQATLVSGVVAVAEDAHVRAGASGFLRAVHAGDGEALGSGALVATLGNEELRRDLAAARARVVEQEARHTVAERADRVSARAIEESLQASRRAAAEIGERVHALRVASPASGHFAGGDLERLAGTWVERGTSLGYVRDPARLRVSVVVPESRMDLFSEPARAVRLRFAAAPGREAEAALSGGVPASLQALPSAALGTTGGGGIPVDPADPDGVTPLVNTFRIDLVTAPGALAGVPVASRVWARFEHASEPLLPRAMRAARRLFLAKFSS